MTDGKTWHLDGTYNFRDLGGLPLTAGGTTRAGVFYRSDALHTLTSTGQQQLEASDIDIVVDLRTPQERDMAPNLIPPGRPIREVELPLLQGDMSQLAGQAFQPGSDKSAGVDEAQAAAVLASLPTLGELYVSMLGGGADSFAQVARLLAARDVAKPGGLLIHCTAGKDRTGVCAALVLDAVGVERTAIVQDYSATQGNLAGPWLHGMEAAITQLGVPMTPALLELVGGSPAEAIEQALGWVDGHGGTEAYLLEGGLAEDDLAALRERLTAG